MRQRIPPRGVPNRGESGAWERKMDPDGGGGGDSSSLGGGSVAGVADFVQPVPMYNPLHFPLSQGALSNPPGSFPMPWKYQHQHQQQHHGVHDHQSYLYTRGQGRISTPYSQQYSHESFYTHRMGIDDTNVTLRPPTTPTFIPDSSYQLYLRTGSISNKNQGPPFCTTLCCARFCAIFSWIAVAFLLFVGILYDTQPLYLPGALPKHYQSTEGENVRKNVQVFYAVSQTERLQPATNAYQAAFVYAITACLCMAYVYNAHYWVVSRWRRYSDIPDADSTVPTFHHTTELPMTLPSTSVGAGGGATILPTISVSNTKTGRAYEPFGAHVTDRLTEGIRMTHNRVRLYLASVWPTYQDHRRARRREAGPKDV